MPALKDFLKAFYLAARAAALRCAAPLLRSRRTGRFSGAPAKILFIRIDRLGDMVLSTPAIRALKERYPAAEITVLASSPAGALVASDPDVSRVIAWGGGLLRRLGTLRTIRGTGFDLAVDPYSDYDIKTALIAFLSGAEHRLGYDVNGRGVFFDIKVQLPEKKTHFVEEALHLLGGIGIKASSGRPRLFVSQDAERSAAALLLSAGISEKDLLIAVHPGGYYPSQRWPAERFRAVCSWLAAEYDAKLLLIGGKKETRIVDYIRSGLAGGTKLMAAIDLSPDILCGIMRRSRCFVGNNSGPLHIASALGLPTVSTMGPTDPVRWRPLGPGQEILRVDLPCSPCNKGFCREHACLDAITTAAMKAAVAATLSRLGIRPVGRKRSGDDMDARP